MRRSRNLAAQVASAFRKAREYDRCPEWSDEEAALIIAALEAYRPPSPQIQRLIAKLAAHWPVPNPPPTGPANKKEKES